MVEPGLVDGLDRVLVGLLAQVEAPNLGPDVLGQRNDIEASLVTQVLVMSVIGFGLPAFGT